jgi:hypothetical protein
MVYELINFSQPIGQVVAEGSKTLTGSVSATLILILFFLIIICMAFGIALEYLSVLVIPYCIAVAAYYNDLLLPLMVIIIFLAMIITKNFIFR